MPAKTVSIDIIPILNRKENRLYDIFVNIWLVLKSVAFTLCEEWVIAAQATLW